MGIAADSARDIRNAFGALEDQMLSVVREETNRALEGMQSQFVPYVSNKNPSDTYLQGRRWETMGSLRGTAEKDGDDILASFFIDPSADVSTNIAAWVNEFGSDSSEVGSIVPRHSEKMNIPVGAMLDAHGVRLFRTTRDARREWVMRWYDDAIYGRRRGTHDDFEKIYVRAERVRVAARPFARPNIEAMIGNLERRVDRLLGRIASN